ncbi:MAG: glycosyltransferase [Candidatus Eremiobacteraeota bacterium]|nr:glycosyltransferase [Candidatus Eremiobacteraeota bacterium]
MSRRKPRVAIVSDPLVQRGGAERVVADGLARAFPDAPIFALLYSSKTGPASIAERVQESWLGRLPGAASRHRLFLPLFPGAAESFDLSEYDIIVSSHHTFAKGVLRGAEQLHVCYCHTPMRALWERSHAELASIPAVGRPIAGAMFEYLRARDYAAAARVDSFVANSATTRRRIRAHYGRDSDVVYPPIDTDAFSPAPGPQGDYYLAASRLVPYKRIDIAIEATARMGKKLVVVGAGPLAPMVRGHEHVEYYGHVSDERLVELMRGARALIFPPLEDFGMTPLEMMACGRPVIGFGEGGAAETIVDGVTGITVAEQTGEAFAAGIARFESMTFDTFGLRRHALRFSRDKFVSTMSDLVLGQWASRTSQVGRYALNERTA